MEGKIGTLDLSPTKKSLRDVSTMQNSIDLDDNGSVSTKRNDQIATSRSLKGSSTARSTTGLT